MNELLDKQCNSDPELCPRLTDQESQNLMKQINSNWHTDQQSLSIARVYEFKNYYQTMAFANSVAWIAHQQDHHPDMGISYRKCEVTYTTHSTGGLTINDFICAARIDALVSQD